MTHTAVFGTTGSGKTTSQIPRALESMRRSSFVGVDPQVSMSRLLASCVKSRINDVIYIKLRNRQQQFRFLNIRYYGDPYLDRDEVMLWSRVFLGRRALDPTTSPLIFEWLEAGLQAIQQSRHPIYFLPYCYKPNTPEFQWILASCQDCPAKQKLELLSCFSLTQVRNETSPTLRVVEPICLDPHFQALSGTDDIDNALLNGSCIILEGGANRETTRTVCLILMIRTMVFCEQNPCRLHLMVDEVENFDLLTPDVLGWLNTLRKQGVEITVITQSLPMDEEARQRLLQACGRREYFRCGPEMAHAAAKDLATSQYDPMAKWYEHNEVPHYLSFAQQQAAIAQDLMRLPVGCRYVNDNGNVLREQTPLPSAFALPGLWEKKAKRVIQRVTQCHEPNDENSWNDFWQSM